MSLFFSPEYVEWKSVEAMHNDAKRWLSALEFVVTEQHFMEDLFGNYFLKLSSERYYHNGKELTEKLELSKRGVELLIKEVQKHNNDLEILADTFDQPVEEKAVKSDHLELQEKVQEVMHGFKDLKVELFVIIGNIMAEDKRKRLLA